MIGKYINQFMADNELLVNEEFFIKNKVSQLIHDRKRQSSIWIKRQQKFVF